MQTKPRSRINRPTRRRDVLIRHSAPCFQNLIYFKFLIFQLFEILIAEKEEEPPKTIANQIFEI